MKKTVMVSFDEEKLSALKMYLEQKGLTLEGELEKALEAQYMKTVPVGVREFLSMRTGMVDKKKKAFTPIVGDGNGT